MYRPVPAAGGFRGGRITPGPLAATEALARWATEIVPAVREAITR
jgi:pantothenate kinase type III